MHDPEIRFGKKADNFSESQKHAGRQMSINEA